MQFTYNTHTQKQSGLSRTNYLIMKVLQDPPPNEPLTQAYIAKTLGIMRNTVSRKLKMLQEHKFILKEGKKIEVLIHV